MNKQLLSPLTEHELTEIQSEQLDVSVNTVGPEEIVAIEEICTEIRHEEEQLPVLKHTESSLQLFSNKMENIRNQNEFRELLEYTPIKAAIQEWLSNLSSGTRRNYAYYMTDMIRRKIIPEIDAAGNECTIGHFRHIPHEMVIDYIKKIDDWSEGTRQLHAACYISFTAYLDRISNGWVRKATPSTLASNPTFFQIRDKCATKALTLAEWHRFIEALHTINYRDSLIARCMFQGAKRISEVLHIKIEQIDFEQNIIRFRQSKTGGTIKEIPISYPSYFMDELKAYIASVDAQRMDRYVFLTRNGKPVTRSRLNYSFEKASKNAFIKRKVTPHMLRATWVTLVKQQGVQDTEIMKVTGHTSSKMIYAYDKTSAEDNYSKKLILI
ncbi:MAG TPA: site-specific integrase [Candidatus Babeliales bacterium]|jgi:integrase|nr:site-specific integrase [Candidatus Babeliales bacterium]